ncbi:anthranilate phosphoribosyltransferase [Geminicoccus roseus]|uniref:anthranilate phosphoribosyltransferase n=1 Tax=Geminicoccus roseus TaxID=404900 RepID=UPI000489EF6B
MSNPPAGGNGLKPALMKLAERGPLSGAEAHEAFSVIMDGAATPAQIGAFLMGLRVRGETVDEIVAAARAMRARMITIEAPEGAVDTCGTGGDHSGTHNISTAVALVAAGAGLPVAKHGNRAATSRSGSSDVLAALGVKLDCGTGLVERAIAEAGVGFMMAPNHHPAMRHVAPIRADLGVRTIFNFLGPLANPARVKRQVVGVAAAAWVEPIAQAFLQLGAERAWVVHGRDGMDELTTTAPSLVAEVKDGRVTTFEVTPEDAGIERARSGDLKGGDAAFNAAAIRAMLQGEPSRLRDAVVFGTAAVLLVAERVADLREGAARATEAIDSGAAAKALERMTAITQGQP